MVEVLRRYSYLRQFAPQLLETFVLRAVVPNEPLLRAVTYLRERNRYGQRGIDDDAPFDFIPPLLEAPRVFGLRTDRSAVVGDLSAGPTPSGA